MTAKNITNHTKSPLGLPTGEIIQPGATIRVDPYNEAIETHPVVKAWLDSNPPALSIDKAPKNPEKSGGEGDAGPNAILNPAPQRNAGNSDDNGSNGGGTRDPNTGVDPAGEPLKAVHRGAGKYVVTQGEVVVAENLDKDAANDFVEKHSPKA